MRYISGNETTVEAMTAPCQENIKENPNWEKNCPTRLFFPKASSRKKPTTVGGRTKGRVNRPSRTACPCFSFTTVRAAQMPRTKVKMVAGKATFKEIHSGERSSIILSFGSRKTQTASVFHQFLSNLQTSGLLSDVCCLLTRPPDRSQGRQLPLEPHRLL